ncbi:MAG: hypothetical protein FWD22_05750 [Treponema sp.]|nr:hypothetical protein [Treponema sp.]
MSKSGSNAKAKAQKKEEAIQKANRKKILIIAICAFIIIAAVVTGIFLSEHHEHKDEEIYSARGQTVRLFADGSFNASLAHGVRKSGTYTKTAEGEIIVVSFNINNRIENGWIVDNALHMPHEWDDGHGHGSVLPRANTASSAHNHRH